jgi:hypothetical protein
MGSPQDRLETLRGAVGSKISCQDHAGSLNATDPCAVSGLLRQLPARAGVHIRQQAEQVGPRLPARFSPPKPAGDVREPGIELLQPTLGRYAVTGGRHTVFGCLHKSPMITWRRLHAGRRAGWRRAPLLWRRSRSTGLTYS